MARLVTKFNYLKPDREKNIGGYAKYIATREGVEKIDDSGKLAPASVRQQQFIRKLLRDFPDCKEMLEYEDYEKQRTVGNASEFISRALEDHVYEMMNTKTYADYIATRPRAERFGTHGLFTDDGVQIHLSRVSEELNLHGGNVWTAIISLRREDAERLGFNTGSRWRDMLRTQTESLATNLKIPMENLKWFAAFHNEGHHPHVHLIAYSTVENEGYLTKQGVRNLRSSFAKDIFAQDLLCVYQKQTEHRNMLRVKSKEVLGEIVEQIHHGTLDEPELEEQLLQLANRLSRTTGKKVYGYLKSDVKNQIDLIVDRIASDERIATLYDLWYEQKEEVLRTYTEELPKRIPLSKNKEFKSVKNTVIQEAMLLLSEKEIVAEMDDTEEMLSKELDVMTDDGIEDEPIEMESRTQALKSSYGRYHKGKNKNDTWWTDGYKQARIYMYGMKELKPDFEKALVLMQLEAEQGNGFAMHDLGKMYLSGLGCEADEDMAQEWFAKAFHSFIQEEGKAKKPGYLRYRIGKMYSFGYGVEQDYSMAAMWYQKAVDEDNPFAAYSLGSLYKRGQGVEQNDEMAFRLYTKAATDERKPNAYAQHELGRMCRDGIGTQMDMAKAEEWYRKSYAGFIAIEQDMADELDNPDAMFGLGKLYLNAEYEKHDVNRALDYLIKAAKGKHSQSQYLFGKLFLDGVHVERNAEYALRWLEESVEQDNPYAEYLLGKTLLSDDEDIPTDAKRGLKLLERAVEQGNTAAMYALGKLYLEGSLVIQDTEKGVSLLKMSADKGFSPAQYRFGKLLYQGELTEQDIAKALEYLKQTSDKGDMYAAYLVGKIRLTEDAYKDITTALFYLERAKEQGNHYAGYQLGKMYLYGKEVKSDYEKAIAYLRASAGQGNQYAAQLLQSIRSNRNWSAALGSLRLLQHISRMLQDRIEEENKGKAGRIDRKLKRKIDEKKQAHGLRQG